MSVTFEVDDCGLPDFLKLAANFSAERYAYVVTPNVDHVIRLYDEPTFREIYQTAGYVLLDSRFLAGMMRAFKGERVTPCPGSDLTAQLFDSIIQAKDKVVLIGGSDSQAQMLRDTYGLTGLRHYNPPMGFINDPSAVDACLQFIENESPFRFCFLAVGCPQQEILARALLLRDKARGLALCVGASIDFMTGLERRAPLWMQRVALEWLYRLMQNPGRMAQRYLVRGPRIFSLLFKISVALRHQPRVATPVQNLAVIEPTQA